MKFRIPPLLNPAEPKFGKDQPWLAPMAGYSDLPFRLLCKELGAVTCETEMISAKGICYQNPGTDILLCNSVDEAPLIAQLFGADPAFAGQATAMLRKEGWLWFDFNLGCPAKKVLRQGAGSALLDFPDTVLAIAKAMLDAVNTPSDSCKYPHIQAKVGFKLRLGRLPDRYALNDLARRLEDIGASWLTLHPRYGSEAYTGYARWEEIEKLARQISIPVIASGDLFSAYAGLDCLEQTHATGLMYARGALRNPQIFTSHKYAISGKEMPDQTRVQLRHIIERHITLTRDFAGQKKALYKIRSIIPRYVRNFRGVGELRKTLCQCSSWDNLSQALDDFIFNADIEE